MLVRRAFILDSRVIKNHPQARRPWLEVTRAVRASEWWEFKLSPILATAYATAFLLKLPVASLWPQLLLTLAALAACAAYVSVVNDLTDFKDDLASGKANRLVGKSRAFAATLLASCILFGLAVTIRWRGELLLLSLYSASWIVFTLYSLRPFRLKGRGVFGVLADASGAHLFPSLLAAAVVYRRQSGPTDMVWFASVAAWSLSFGVRGILWHQIGDLRNDEKIGLGTFARKHKTVLLRRLVHFLIFPAEVAAFCCMLWRTGSTLAFALLCYYLLLAFLRKRLWGMNLVVVVPEAKSYIVMQEYYEVFFPLAFLLSSSRLYPLDALMIVPHLILFPRRALRSVKDVKIFGQAAKLFIMRIRGR
jgi:hypothetical protein